MSPRTRGKYIDELLDDLDQLLARKEPASKLKNCIDKIGLLADKSAIPKLLPFLDDKTDYVRASAIEALQKIRDVKSLDKLLLDKLHGEQSTLVQITIVDALGEIGEETAIEALQRVKDATNDDKVRIAVIFSLDRLTKGKIAAMDQLVNFLIDARNPNVRVEAAKALGRLGDPRAIKHLIAALDDEKIFVRKFIIKSLVSFGEKSVVGPIINAFADEKSFIDRDFINVLWAFPEYNGKELWEIIEIHQQEKLDEIRKKDDASTSKQCDTNQDIKTVYAYEEKLNQDEVNMNQDFKQPPDDPCDPGTEQDNQGGHAGGQNDQRVQEDLSLAKDERVPDKGEGKEGESGENELNEFSKYFIDGEKYYRKKRYYEAILNFKKAITIKYDAWQAWYNLGLVFYDIDEKQKSVECFEQALLFKPNELDTRLNLGGIYNDLGQYGKAIAHLIEALKLSKYQTDAWLLLGKIMLKLNHDEFALFCFNEVLQYSNAKKERAFAREKAESIMKKHPRIARKDPRVEALPPAETDEFKLRF